MGGGPVQGQALPEPQREQAYLAQLAQAPWQVKLCKLADLFDNGLDSRQLQPAKAARSRQRYRQYLEALGAHLPDQARSAYELVQRLYQELDEANPSGT